MPANRGTLAQLPRGARLARQHGYGGFSTGEQLFAALVRNRADWIAELYFTIDEVFSRLGPDWTAEILAGARTLRDQ
jgi:hypothetical protein